RQAARAVLRFLPVPVLGAGPLSHLLLTAGVGQRGATAAGARVPRSRSRRALAYPHPAPPPTGGMGPGVADRAAPGRHHRRSGGRGHRSDLRQGAAGLAARHRVAAAARIAYHGTSRPRAHPTTTTDPARPGRSPSTWSHHADLTGPS